MYCVARGFDLIIANHFYHGLTFVGLSKFYELCLNSFCWSTIASKVIALETSCMVFKPCFFLAYFEEQVYVLVAFSLFACRNENGKLEKVF